MAVKLNSKFKSTKYKTAVAAGWAILFRNFVFETFDIVWNFGFSASDLN